MSFVNNVVVENDLEKLVCNGREKFEKKKQRQN